MLLQRHKELYRGRVFGLRRFKYVAQGGRTIERDVIVHPGAAAIVPLLPRDRVVLVRQTRIATGKMLWEIPAGTLARGEAPLACAKRELTEETGWIAGRFEKIAEFFTAPGFCTEKLHVYLARDLSQGKTHFDDDEDIAVRAVPLAAALAWIENGRIQDAKSIIGLLKAAEMLRARRGTKRRLKKAAPRPKRKARR